MDPKAKGEFLKKISINGFSITEEGDRLTLRPRGMEATAEITIEEAKPNEWKVISVSGRYAGFGHGLKRKLFDSYINRWAMESVLQTGG